MQKRRTERAILINDYLVPNKGVYGESEFSHNKLGPFLHNLISFERPDMYSVVDNDVLILEHFEFDGSERTSKGGMKGIAQENTTEMLEDYSMPFDDSQIKQFSRALNYKQSSNCYYSNFKAIFDKHYGSIPDYIKNIKNRIFTNQYTNITVGFFIENKFPPYYLESKNKHDNINLICTRACLEKKTCTNMV